MRRLRATLLTLVAGVATIAASVVMPATAIGAPTGAVPRYDHIFVIVEENHGFADVIGNPAAPNLNALAKQFGLGTKYFGISHPSEPNYVALLGGNFFGIADDNPYFMNSVAGPSLISQLDQAGISWKAYLQGVPHAGFEGICYPSKCNGAPDIDPLYVSKHNAIPNFKSSLNPTDWSRQVPIQELSADLAAGKAPASSSPATARGALPMGRRTTITLCSKLFSARSDWAAWSTPATRPTSSRSLRCSR